MLRSLRKHAREWKADERGNFTVIASLAAPPVALMIAALATYANGVTQRTKTQAAADAAALAATAAYASGNVNSVAGMQAVATKFFNANAPAGIGASTSNVVKVAAAVPASGSGFATTKVSFCGQTQSLIGSATGGNSFCVDATSSTATAQTTISNAKYALYDAVAVWGDPRVDTWQTNGVVDSNIGNKAGGFTCVPGSWINLFSDYHFQINGMCVGTSDGGQFISEVAIVMDDAKAYMRPDMTGRINFSTGGRPVCSFRTTGLPIQFTTPTTSK